MMMITNLLGLTLSGQQPPYIRGFTTSNGSDSCNYQDDITLANTTRWAKNCRGTHLFHSDGVNNNICVIKLVLLVV